MTTDDTVLIQPRGRGSYKVHEREQGPRSLATWARRGGLSSLVFALPILFVFGVFSWWPIVSSVVMSLQESNLVDAPTWVGLDNFRAVLTDPLLPTVIRNTAWFAILAMVFGYPIPLVGAVLMSELRRRKGFYSASRTCPSSCRPSSRSCSGSSSTTRARKACSTRCWAGWASVRSRG